MPGVRLGVSSMAVHVRVWQFMSEYGSSCPSMAVHVRVWQFMSKYGSSCPSMAVHVILFCLILSSSLSLSTSWHSPKAEIEIGTEKGK